MKPTPQPTPSGTNDLLTLAEATYDRTSTN
jgi:hypothetical protein